MIGLIFPSVPPTKALAKEVELVPGYCTASVCIGRVKCRGSLSPRGINKALLLLFIFYSALFCTVQLMSNLYLLCSKSVKSIPVIVCSVTEAASSAEQYQRGLLFPTPRPHPLVPPPSSWLLFSHHAAWHSLLCFCPVLTSSQHGSIWLQPLQHRL